MKVGTSQIEQKIRTTSEKIALMSLVNQTITRNVITVGKKESFHENAPPPPLPGAPMRGESLDEIHTIGRKDLDGMLNEFKRQSPGTHLYIVCQHCGAKGSYDKRQDKIELSE